MTSNLLTIETDRNSIYYGAVMEHTTPESLEARRREFTMLTVARLSKERGRLRMAAMCILEAARSWAEYCYREAVVRAEGTAHEPLYPCVHEYVTDRCWDLDPTVWEE
jgi:hypothetical protein